MSNSDEARKGKLEVLESKVEQWWVSTLAAAEALVEIRTTELYKETHPTFEEYVAERWQKTKQWAYDLCNWFEINLLAGVGDDHLSMAATRPLKPLRSNPKKVKQVVAKAMSIAKKGRRSSPTAKDVEEAKQSLFPPKEKKHKFFYNVLLTGEGVGVLGGRCAKIGHVVTEEDDSLDLNDLFDLGPLFRLLAEVAAEKGKLKVNVAIERFDLPEATPAPVAAN